MYSSPFMNARTLRVCQLFYSRAAATHTPVMAASARSHRTRLEDPLSAATAYSLLQLVVCRPNYTRRSVGDRQVLSRQRPPDGSIDAIRLDDC